MKKIASIAFLASVYLILTLPYWQEQADSRLAPLNLPVSGETSQEKLGPVEMNPSLLIIPSLSIQAPIVEVEETSERVFQEGLKNGVVHYPGTAQVGESGNTYIFGHSSDYVWKGGDYKAVFARLPEIKTGDEILVSNKQGKKFTYKVIDTLVASPRDIELLDQHNYEKKLLTLQTSYPLGTALKRFIAIAELVELK